MHSETAESFGQGEKPAPSEIVILDGFDQLDKEDAIAFYAGKTWQEVLAHLRSLKDEAVISAGYFLEEWSVLSPKALAYYLRGYLEFLKETLASVQPDEEYIFHFFGALYQVVYMHKGSPFTVHQTDLLKQIALVTTQKATDHDAYPYYGHDIAANIAEFLAELERHGK